MSITTVFFDSQDVYAGQYHKASIPDFGHHFISLIEFSIHMERSIVSFRSTTLSNWKVCLWARTGKVQAGRASDQAHTTTLAQEVAEVWLCSSCPVAGLHTTLNQESHSLRAYDTASLYQ